MTGFEVRVSSATFEELSGAGWARVQPVEAANLIGFQFLFSEYMSAAKGSEGSDSTVTIVDLAIRTI